MDKAKERELSGAVEVLVAQVSSTRSGLPHKKNTQLGPASARNIGKFRL